MKSDLFDAFPDWVPFVVVLLCLPIIARIAVKERSRLTAIQADPNSTEEDRAKATKLLSRQKMALPMFGALVLLATIPFILISITK